MLENISLMLVSKLILLFSVFLLVCTDFVSSSHGDKSNYFRDCMFRCEAFNCTSEQQEALYERRMPFHLKLFFWSCFDDCKYNCMWSTVDILHELNYPPVQFYGKWPFTRILGIQEPASAVASVLNGIVHWICWRDYVRSTSSNTPLYFLWYGYGIINLNCWVWSTVYHTRDKRATETADYLCASLVVVYSFCCVCSRIIGVKSKVNLGMCIVGCLAFYVAHGYYLLFIRWDYHYNMKTNITVGLCNSLGWICWALLQYAKYRQTYHWKSFVCIILINSFLLLEVMDFAPLWNVFDAHSLWHLSTIPIPFLFYSFLKDDSMFLLQRQKFEQIRATYEMNYVNEETKKTK